MNTLQVEEPLKESTGRVRRRQQVWANLHAWHSLPRTQPSHRDHDVDWTSRRESSFFRMKNSACNVYTDHSPMTRRKEEQECAQRASSSCITVDIHPFFRLHHSTTYIDVAYCYRSSSVVCLSVCHTWALQKRLDWSRCPLGWGLRWAQGTMH